MTDTIFNGADKAPDTSKDGEAQAGESIEQQLSFVGEGKKYKSIEELDKAYLNADTHIKKIEQENAELRERVSAAKGIEEVLATLGKTEGDGEQTETQDAKLDPSVIQSLVEQTIEQRESLNRQRVNATEVVTKLREIYGDSAEEVFNAKQTELGVDLNAIAMSSPKAALALLVPTQPQEQAKSAQESTVNSESLMSKHRARVGTYDYWKQQYQEGKINQEQMLQGQHRSLKEMGREAFYQK